MKRIQTGFAIALLAWGATACSTTPTESLGEFNATLYLEGYLIAGQPVDSIFIGTTSPLLETFEREDLGIPDAIVTLVSADRSWILQPQGSGYYASDIATVESGMTYTLTAETMIGALTATTMVPPPPLVTSTSTIVTAESADITVSWSGVTVAGYVTTRKPVALGSSIPLTFQFGGGRFGGGGFDTTGFGARRDSLAQVEQWRFLPGATATPIVYQSFTRFGTYRMVVYSLDTNYGDFLVSSQQDPRLLDEPRFHVEGGIGLFASMAPDSVAFAVE